MTKEWQRSFQNIKGHDLVTVYDKRLISLKVLSWKLQKQTHNNLWENKFTGKKIWTAMCDFRGTGEPGFNTQVLLPVPDTPHIQDETGWTLLSVQLPLFIWSLDKTTAVRATQISWRPWSGPCQTTKKMGKERKEQKEVHTRLEEKHLKVHLIHCMFRRPSSQEHFHRTQFH